MLLSSARGRARPPCGGCGEVAGKAVRRRRGSGCKCVRGGVPAGVCVAGLQDGSSALSNA
eukprot:360117-Chlamydomonas_euryale.AAC.1